MKTTKYMLALAAALIALLAPRAVLADTVFTASGTFSDGSTLSGTVTINTTTGAVTGADLLWTDVAAPLSTDILLGVVFGNLQLSAEDTTGVDYIELDFPFNSQSFPVGYAGGPLCSNSDTAGFCYSDTSLAGANLTPTPLVVYLEQGSLTPPAGVPAPEPRGLLLLSIGLLGLMGVIRRKRLA